MSAVDDLPVSSARLDELVAELRATLARAAQSAPVALASSLSAEDMVITDAIARDSLAIGVFTIDTGRLHADTLALVPAIQARYGITVEVFRPDQAAVAAYVASNGRDAFYQSSELRKSCCHVRKVEPLERALTGRNAWITGLRREQAATRTEVPVFGVDADRGLLKINPLAAWTEQDVWAYIRLRDVPYNRLHDQGYPSIGCAPCTRPVTPGEDVRAGRWWWETPEGRECGLHVAADGRLIRAKQGAQETVA